MGWSIGYDRAQQRWIGYGVPARCDHPKCTAVIDRGLSYVCGGEPYGGEHGCGRFFCDKHMYFAGSRREHVQLCPRCVSSKRPYKTLKSEHPAWINHLLTDESWEQWRAENPEDLARFQSMWDEARDRPIVEAYLA